MRTRLAAAVAAGLLVSACGGGGQTDATAQEEALANEYDPSAPSPGGRGAANGTTAGQAGGGNAAEGATAAQAPAPMNGQ